MSRVISAEARITAKDATGNTFDKIASKLKGVEKNAKALESIKAPKFTGDLYKELGRLKLTEKELEGVRKSYADFEKTLRSAGPVRASHYFRAIDDWKSRTVGHWREVKASVDDAEKSHSRFFKNARHLALHAAGIGGGLYAAGHAAREVAGQIGDRGRELARYSLGGIDPSERAAAEAKAGEISSRYPSISRTEVLEHIRQLRSRLGSFEEATANIETIAKAQTVLSTLGLGDTAGEDLEKLTLGLESQGLGANPAKFSEYMSAFVKAKSLFPDLRGDDFRQFMRVSNSSKYGLSSDYLQTVVPTMMQHEGASNFGVMQASAFSALIGKRQSDAAKAKMRSYGLLDTHDNLKDAARFIENPYAWAVERLAPALESKGLTLDEAHRGKMVEAMTQMFSNRKVAEFFSSLLVNQAVIEKDRRLLGAAAGTEGAAMARAQDPYIAWSGVTTQLKDFGAALVGTKQAIDLMNSTADEIAKRTEAIRKGEWRKLLPEDDQRILNWFFPGERDRLQQTVDDANSWLGRHDDQGGASRAWRLKRFEAEQQLHVAEMNDNMPPIFTDAELERMRANYVPLPMADPRRAASGERIPFPASRPTGAEGMPPVQPLDLPAHVDVQGTVQGQVNQTITLSLQPSKYWEALERQINSVVEMMGYLRGNGPGSAGTSSIDAAAPAPRSAAPGFPGY